ncbi:FkbM family methyltransferase [Acaryochloris sp. 'Moss Beach']|uniref:FkbM family methyltransferase n=1 Tax=Acaryochloris sp. 'Moss Beach' TaxID=2740837 RepID=UPI001F021D83|nr:FkbM family methyltransferase [Acaryochloris sp. 'Moss Beach']
MNIKQVLLGNWFGDLAMFSREKIDLLRAAISQSEAVGTIANDQLAGRLVCSICDPNKTFLDIGAHIGSVTSAVQRYDATVNIIAVEAIPEKAEKLRHKFPHIPIYACAVGEEEGEIAFFIDLQQTGYSSINRPTNLSQIREIQVPIQRLDNLISRDTEVDVIKIDIEGAELGALRGAVDILSRSRPTVMFESAPSDASDAKKDLFDYFDQRHYAILVPNRLAHNDNGLTKTGFLESHLYPRRTTNYFAVHKDRRQKIRDKARRVLRIRVE